MSDRKLVLLPVGFLVAWMLFSPILPEPRPLPPGVTWCDACQFPAWADHPAPILMALSIFGVFLIGLVKLYQILRSGRVPNVVFYRFVAPLLRLVFLGYAAEHFAMVAQVPKFRFIPYDFTSLAPLLMFAAVDFVFAVRLWRRSAAT